MSRTLFITGTDTDVGKTFVTLEIARGLKAAGKSIFVFKPICTGVNGSEPSDVETLSAAFSQDVDDTCPARFREPLSPPSAALRENRQVSIVDLDAAFDRNRARNPEFLLIEGAGGAMCPVDDDLTMVDLAARWQVPVLIVAGVRLGAISHTLLSCEAAQSRSLNWSVVLCESHDVSSAVRESTVFELATRLRGRITGYMPYGGPLLNFDPTPPTIGAASNESADPMTAEDLACLFPS